jgi:lipoyl-dependent peroxiredoxin
MASINRDATAVWTGAGKDGRGTLTTQSATLKETPYSANTRFGDGKGTNPEELIAAAHAACFTMALSFALAREGLTAGRLETTARVKLDRDGDGFTISRSDLSLDAEVPGIDEDRFRAIAEGAKAACPVSKLFNAEIGFDFRLHS